MRKYKISMFRLFYFVLNFAKQPVSPCETACFAHQNRLFRRAKQAV